MNVRCVLIILCLFLLGENSRALPVTPATPAAAQSSTVSSGPAVAARPEPLLRCLGNKNLRGLHRLDREVALRQCYARYKTSKKTCYRTLKSVIGPQESLRLTEDIRSVCFYDAQPAARTVEDCVQEAAAFKVAAEHDEAVFYCYQQFQEKIDRRQCLKTARQLIYPAKEDYLTQHCRATY